MKKMFVCTSVSFLFSLLMAAPLQCRGADTPPPPGISGRSAAPVNVPVNYVLHVNWKGNRGETNSLLLVTTEGGFKMDTSLPSGVNLGDSDLPLSVNVSGDLNALSPELGRLQLFLGRSVPYLSHMGGPPGSTSIQQRQEGLNCTFFVTFGKPVLLHKDPNGEVSVLVVREKP